VNKYLRIVIFNSLILSTGAETLICSSVSTCSYKLYFICAESIALAWHKFRKKYYENESNIYEAKIFSNPEISSSVGQKLEITIFHGNRIQVVMETGPRNRHTGNRHTGEKFVFLLPRSRSAAFTHFPNFRGLHGGN
jgi:hypothetical protein